MQEHGRSGASLINLGEPVKNRGGERVELDNLGNSDRWVSQQA